MEATVAEKVQDLSPLVVDMTVHSPERNRMRQRASIEHPLQGNPMAQGAFDLPDSLV
jgi:hypothetical protein